ncbi:hypothetical protein BD413DRAFT_206786 [Trametes elegans]|nr:hypothetical protein BD413DRAFT_206786 [Trametes elegans]
MLTCGSNVWHSRCVSRPLCLYSTTLYSRRARVSCGKDTCCAPVPVAPERTMLYVSPFSDIGHLLHYPPPTIRGDHDPRPARHHARVYSPSPLQSRQLSVALARTPGTTRAPIAHVCTFHVNIVSKSSHRAVPALALLSSPARSSNARPPLRSTLFSPSRDSRVPRTKSRPQTRDTILRPRNARDELPSPQVPRPRDRSSGSGRVMGARVQMQMRGTP